MGAFASKTRFLDPAKGGLGGADETLVDPYHPNLQIFFEASGCTLIKNSHKTLFWPGFSYFEKLKIGVFSQNYVESRVSMAENLVQ